jgi:hypothetical protein
MPQFDVFLSHSSADKSWVTKLKDDLLRYGVSVWLDKDEIRPGDLFGKALEQALDNSRAVALVVSPEAINSGWVEEEYYRALTLAENKQTPAQIIPVILRDAELPGFLQSRNWVDFRDETTYAQSVWTLVWGITGKKPAQVLDLTSPDVAPTAPVDSAKQTEALNANTTTSSNIPGKSQIAKMMTPHQIDLTESLQRNTLALFIGADLPGQVTGLPSRSDLARELARRQGLDESLPLAEVAQRASQAGNRWAFTDFVRQALDTSGSSPRPFHKRVVALVKEHQIETVITTAYDNSLELAFQEATVGINRVVRGSDVSFINPDRPTLIKLYGDMGQPDSMVVTDRDHSDLLRDREKEPILEEVRRAFRRNTMLFLGYDLADPDFRFLFDGIAESRFARTAYAIWPGLTEADVRMWRDRGIVILADDPLDLLDQLAVPPTPLPL